MRPKIVSAHAEHASGMSARPKLGIIAGEGRLPAQLVEACLASGREVFVLGFEDTSPLDILTKVPHAIVPLGAIGEALDILHKAQVKEVVLAGRVQRPVLSALKLDASAIRLMGRMGTAFFSGDNVLFKSIVAFLEEEGFNVIGADNVLSDLSAPEGVLGSIAPDQRHQADIAHGIKVGKLLGQMDIGQGVIVEHGYVLGVEAAEGTDELIARCAKLKHERHAGVLVKVKKPLQEVRVDLPTIGPKTVENVHAAGLAGIAVESGGSLILDREEVIKKANALGIFVVGVRYG